MKIAVLGATGRTGVPFVERAVAAGHDVTALVRTPSKRSLLPEGVTVVEGDAADADAVDQLVAGSDAVVDLIAPERGGPQDLRSRVVPRVLDAMRAHGVDRLVFLTGAGVRVEQDTPGLADRAIVWLMRRFAADALADGEQATAAVAGSGLGWTVVRAPRLNEDEETGQARAFAGVGQGSSTRISRADLARWILEELEDPQWTHRPPVVTW
jgi:putative NADH-flavin reductase